MALVAVANPKGGVGKSTLATNIAGYYASRGHAVALGDVDGQQSARWWLGERPQVARSIQLWEATPDWIGRPPRDARHAVLDTPAGLQGWRLKDVLRKADRIVVPLQASVFDIYATQDFLSALHQQKRARKLQLGVVANRVKDHTKAADNLQAFLRTLDIPWLAQLRDTQNYTHLAAHGLSLWDVPPHKVDKDLAQWRPIVEWLTR